MLFIQICVSDSLSCIAKSRKISICYIRTWLFSFAFDTSMVLHTKSISSYCPVQPHMSEHCWSIRCGWTIHFPRFVGSSLKQHVELKHSLLSKHLWMEDRVGLNFLVFKVFFSGIVPKLYVLWKHPYLSLLDIYSECSEFSSISEFMD